MKAMLSIILSAVGVLIVTVAVQAQAPAPANTPFVDEASGQTALPCMDASGKDVDVPRYSVGSSFEGHKLTKSFRRCDRPDPMGRANFASEIYGSCDAKPGKGCAPPMEIQTFPACERNSNSYTLNPEGDPLPRENVKIAGLPGAIFEGGHRVEVYMHNATVVIFGENPAQIRRAATQLRKVAKASGAVEMPCAAPAGAVAG